MASGARGDKDYQPGDIVVFQGSLVHHAVIERIEGGMVHTIDGNISYQQIGPCSRPVSSIWYYYRTV